MKNPLRLIREYNMRKELEKEEYDLKLELHWLNNDKEHLNSKIEYINKKK